MIKREFYDLTPMKVAATVTNLDLSKLQDPALAKSLYADWIAHGLLIFRGVPVDNAQHIALSRCFGELEMHPLPEIRSKEEPLLMELGGPSPDKAYIYDEGEMIVGRVAWHRDTAYTKEISKGAMLRVVEFPETGGETDFVDTALAYDALSDAVIAKIENLEFKATLRLDQREMKLGTTWKTLRRATESEAPGSRDAVPFSALSRYPSVVHPLVVTHPESGRKCIYISPTYLDAIIGVSPEESDALLKMIVDHTLSPQFQYRHVWQKDDLVLWDNRRMIHAATGYPPQYRRRALRTTLAGSMNTGRLYDPNETAKSAALVD